MDRERKIKLWTSIAVCLLFVLLLVVVGQIVSIATLKAKQQQLLEEQEKLQKDRGTIAEIIEYRESDRYVEQIAREYYNMKKDENHD